MSPFAPTNSRTEREQVPGHLKEEFPWLKSMQEYVNKWLPEGFPDHIDANEVYASLARTKNLNSGTNHSLYRSLRSELEKLIIWMSARDTWSSNMPFVGSASTIMSLCCLVPGQEGLPSTIRYLVETAKLTYLLHPLGKIEVDPFWHGAMLEDEDWRAEHILFGKTVTTHDILDEDLNKFFKGVMPLRTSTHRCDNGPDTLNAKPSKKRRRADSTDDALDASDKDDIDLNTGSISEKIQTALVDTLEANTRAFKDSIQGIVRGAITSRPTMAQCSESVENLKDEMKFFIDQMEIIINERLDDLEGNVSARLDGVESAVGNICKRLKILEDTHSRRASRPQETPLTPQSGPRVHQRQLREHHFESMTPSPTSATSSYFDAKRGTPGTPSPPQFGKKVSIEDRASIVRAINDIPVTMWAKDDIPIIRRCRAEFPHPKWPSIIFTIRSAFLRGGFIDPDGKPVGDGELVISEADWDVLSGLRHL